MKRLLFCVILFIFTNFSCFPEMSFSVTPALSTSFGKYGEYVYSWTGKSVVSYLEWQQLPLFKFGLQADFTYNNCVISSNFFYGLSLKCGKMYDSDWGSKGVKTTYSISDNNAIRNYDFSLNLSYKLYFNHFSLIPEISYSYYYDYFQSSNGEGWYGSENYSKNGKEVSWDSPYAKHYRKLSRIELKRNSSYFFTGITFEIPLGHNFELSLGTYFSPYSYVYNSDLHLDDNGSGKDFYLKSTQNMYFSRFLGKISFKFKINKYLIIPLNIDCILGDIEKGILEGYEQYGGTDIILFTIKSGLQFIK